MVWMSVTLESMNVPPGVAASVYPSSSDQFGRELLARQGSLGSPPAVGSSVLRQRRPGNHEGGRDHEDGREPTEGTGSVSAHPLLLAH